MIQLTITPQRKARLEGHPNELHLLVRAVVSKDAAPLPVANARPPLNLAIVIDRSGSMSGRPLDEAKRAAAFMVEHLRPQDRVAIVAYCNAAEVTVPGTRVGGRTEILRAIGSIQSGGMTALHAGWLAGVEQVALMRAPHEMGRVLLLSDGQANVGERNPAVLAEDAARIAATGITTTTCGLGAGFDEMLMTAMARAGHGSAYYGETAEDLMDPFREEFELLANLRARRLRLRLVPGDGVDATLLNGYREEAGVIMLPDLAEGGEAWAMVRLRFDEGAGQPEDRLLLQATLRFETLDGQQSGAGPVTLRLPRLPGGAFAAIAADETVTARLNELRAADLQDQARVAARARDWIKVDQLIVKAREEAGDNQWIKESLAVLEGLARKRDVERFSKESAFTAVKMRSRLTSLEESASSAWQADVEASKPAYLRKKASQGRRLDRPEEDTL